MVEDATMATLRDEFEKMEARIADSMKTLQEHRFKKDVASETITESSVMGILCCFIDLVERYHTESSFVNMLQTLPPGGDGPPFVMGAALSHYLHACQLDYLTGLSKVDLIKITNGFVHTRTLNYGTAAEELASHLIVFNRNVLALKQAMQMN